MLLYVNKNEVAYLVQGGEGVGVWGAGGGGGGGVSGSTARSDPEDRGGRGPSPEQQLCYGSGDLAIA